MKKILNKISGGYNCTCNEGYSGTGRNIEIMDASEVMIQKPGCLQNRSNATQSTPTVRVSTTSPPLIPLVNILNNSTITAQEKSNDTFKEFGTVLNSNAISKSFDLLLLTYFISFAWNKLKLKYASGLQILRCLLESEVSISVFESEPASQNLIAVYFYVAEVFESDAFEFLFASFWFMFL